MRERPDAPTAMSAEEAEAIVRNAGAGILDTRDPDVRRQVARAQRTIARTALWGDAASTRHHRYLWWGVAFLAMWVVGLAVPMAVMFGWFG